MTSTAAPAPTTVAVGAGGVPWVATLLPLAVLLAAADEFWIVALRTAAGPVVRAADPATSWARESVALLPLYAAAVVAALGLARRAGRRPVLGPLLLVAGAGALAGIAVLVASSAYDYHLQLVTLADHASVHGGCGEACREARDAAALLLEVRTVGVGAVLLLVTDLALVAWVVALKGRPLRLSQPTAGSATRGGDHVATLSLLVAGSGAVHLAVVPEHLAEWRAAGLFFVLAAAGQLLAAFLLRRTPAHGLVLLGVAAGSAALLLLWGWSRTVGLPLGPESGEPEAMGLADVCAGALELAAVVLALVLLRDRDRDLDVRRGSGHAHGVVVASVVAVTLLGVGGSTLPGAGLLAPTEESGHGTAQPSRVEPGP